MNTKKEKIARDFHFTLAELMAGIENLVRLCPTETIIELCETLAGIMAEQTTIIATMEKARDMEARDTFKRPIVGERFYSSHAVVICDMMRLARRLKELSNIKNGLLQAIKNMSRYDDVPLDAKFLADTYKAIPRVKTLKDDKCNSE